MRLFVKNLWLGLLVILIITEIYAYLKEKSAVSLFNKAKIVDSCHPRKIDKLQYLCNGLTSIGARV